MSRTADYTIQGFLYQLNKTLIEILGSADDDVIVVEGLIEDIDIHAQLRTKAVQCKYHEGQSVFTLSNVYKPLLQMMDHYHHNVSANVEYLLFSHFPNKIGESNLSLTNADVREILSTTNKDLAPYVKKLESVLDVDGFLGRLTIEFGPSFEDLSELLNRSLIDCGFLSDDVSYIVYPNALHFIAELSIKHDPSNRRTSKGMMLQHLIEIKSTTISRWTLALKTIKKILQARKKQLANNLSKNVRRRSFLISSSAASDFTEGIVVFISDYLNKFHFKSSHTETPIFCLDCDAPTFDKIRQRIHQKGIRFNDGYIGPDFDRSHFARDPVVNPRRDRPIRDFSIRLARYETEPALLSSPKCDDFFLISSKQYPSLELADVNVERLLSCTLRQTKFLLGVTDGYE